MKKEEAEALKKKLEGGVPLLSFPNRDMFPMHNGQLK